MAIKDKMSERVAQAIKDRREQLGLSLRALATRSNVSTSMISDVERGAKSPTITTLFALAQALEVPVSALVENTGQQYGRIHVVRASERPEVVDPSSGGTRDSYKPTLPSSNIELIRCSVPPRTEVGPFVAHAKGTIEHMYLASGSVRLVFGSDAVKLDAGDCCSCLADAPHVFDNKESDTEALIYIVAERPRIRKS